SALERLGVEHLRREQYEPANEALDRAVKVNPNGAASQYALGVSQFHLRRLAAVVESLQRSLQLAPGSPNAAFAHFYLGLSLWKLGKPAAAEPHLKKACELGGNSMPPDIHLHLAKHYSDTTRFREAADELELFLKLAPDARDADNIRELARRLRTKAQTSNGLMPLS
ncbi:MAG: tetratricopeptide repeat protein, partial [Blastocatellia bacterium]